MAKPSLIKLTALFLQVKTSGMKLSGFNIFENSFSLYILALVSFKKVCFCLRCVLTVYTQIHSRECYRTRNADRLVLGPKNKMAVEP